MRSILANMNWDYLFMNSSTLEVKMNCFYSVNENCIHRFFPHKDYQFPYKGFMDDTMSRINVNYSGTCKLLTLILRSIAGMKKLKNVII